MPERLAPRNAVMKHDVVMLALLEKNAGTCRHAVERSSTRDWTRAQCRKPNRHVGPHGCQHGQGPHLGVCATAAAAAATRRVAAVLRTVQIARRRGAQAGVQPLREGAVHADAVGRRRGLPLVDGQANGQGRRRPCMACVRVRVRMNNLVVLRVLAMPTLRMTCTDSHS